MKKLLVSIVCVLGLVLIVTNARAITIPLAYGDPTSYVGYINDGIPSSGLLELGYVTDLITLGAGANNTVIGTETYNRIDSSLASLLPVNAYLGKDTSAPFSWTVGTNDPFYIYGKYDGPNYGSLVWLVDASIGDVVTLPSGAGENPAGEPYGLSHISGFSATPIPSTVYLFVSGLAGLVGIARFRRKRSN